MTAIEKIHEALARTKPTGSRGYTSTALEHRLGEEFADAFGGFDTHDLIVAILEAEGLGADLEERRKIATALAWPVSEALHIKSSEGYRQGFDTCRAQTIRRLFG